MTKQKSGTTDLGAGAIGVCAPDAACRLLGCNLESGQRQCIRYSEIVELRENLKKSGHTIKETFIRCGKCKGINGHNGDCENRFGIRINTLATSLCPQIGTCPATKVQKPMPLPVDECTQEAYKSCTYYQA